ncbi:MAG: TIGR03621 family F420-dependent LLM class oxidoreductase [Anaerolineales bacterium]|nr:TIGR03621 family F420-dependent LLM class oxidoreductase [Anaerolineales bacterium]
MLRSFRFGVTCDRPVSASQWRDTARQAEALGYDVLLMPDHFVGQMATLPALAFAAAHTTTLRVGSLVCNNDFRHPLLLAKEAATLDLLSAGRFELGLGAGWLKSEYDAIQLPFDPPAVRVTRLAEAIQMLKAYFQGEPMYAGDFYRMNSQAGLDHLPRPVQQPQPPLLIGAGGRRMLTLAARQADIVSLAVKVKADGSGPDPADLAVTPAEKAAWVRHAAGERAANIKFHIQTWAVAVTTDRQAAAEAVAAQLGVPAPFLLDTPYVMLGTVNEIAAQLARYREQFGLTYISVFARDMAAIAPVIAQLR